jgi:Pilus assembly protein, PilO
VSLTPRDKKIALALVPLILIGAYWFLLLKPKRHEAAKLTDQVTHAQSARDAAVQKASQLEQAKTQFPTQYAEMVRLGKAVPTTVDMPSLLVQLDEAARGTGIQFGEINVGQRLTTPIPSLGSSPGAGGSPAATTFGKAVEAAKRAHNAETSSAAQSSSASNSVGTTGASGSSTPASSATSNAPGLDEVPLTFKFAGQFDNLASFFHRLKRFVHIANDKVSVQGRLITIDSLKFTTLTFPHIEADVTATVYLTPKTEGVTAGASSSGPLAAQAAAIQAVAPPSTTGSQ